MEPSWRIVDDPKRDVEWLLVAVPEMAVRAPRITGDLGPYFGTRPTRAGQFA
jgi:hypothetical protein